MKMLCSTALVLALVVGVDVRAGTSPKDLRARLDVAPQPHQKPYAPADGQVLSITPPPFLWVPAGKDAVYAVQVSRTKTFPPTDTTTFADIRRSAFVPDKTLPCGQWFWRYGVQADEGVVYGRARPFSIAKDARSFPFPELDALVNRIPKQRPRLFFPGERLTQIRQLGKGDLGNTVQRLARACTKEIGRELVAEPPRPKTGPERVNVMRTTRPPMDVMERCALAYLLTGDKRLGLEAKRRLQHFFSWDPRGSTALFSYDEPAMWMMMRGTRAYDWTYDLFTPAERAKLEPVMRERAGQFLSHLQRRPFESNPYESHAGRMPGFLGEAALSFIHEWPEARQWLEYANLLYYTSYPAWGGDDGGWQEGPGYWSAYMSFALHYVAALKAATGVDLMNKPFLRNTPYYALYTATAYHEHRPFGDGQYGSPRGLGSVMHAFAGLLGDRHFRWYAEAAGFRPGGDVLSLATYDPKLKPQTPLDLPPARVFPAVGLVSMHTALGDHERDISFLLRSSPLGSVSHGHADQNAFVLEAFGRGLAIATGYYPWYGSPHHHNWTRATKAVNSILVDGTGQVRRRRDANGRITAFQTTAGYDYTEGQAAPAYGDKLTRFSRKVLHVRPGIFVMLDELAAHKPSTFQWLLHAYDKIRIDHTNRRLRIERSPAALSVHLLMPTELTLTQTDRYDPPPETSSPKSTWHLTASTKRPEKSARFLTVLLPHRMGKESSLPTVESLTGTGAVGVRLRFPNGDQELVAFRVDSVSKDINCAGLRGEGDVLARRTSGEGKVVQQFRSPH